MARPISGLTPDEVFEYFDENRRRFQDYGYEVLCPMTGKDYFRNSSGTFHANGYEQPLSKDRAILGRDSWMVHQSDVVFLNLFNAKKISIGCVCELAMAWDNKKHTVVVMEKGNVHEHSFILEMTDVRYETLDEGYEYMKSLGRS